MRRKGEAHPVCVVGVSALAVLALTILAFDTAPAIDDAMAASQLVDKARLTVDTFTADENLTAFRDLVKQAKGVFVAPQVLRGAFIIGASGGSGVLLARDDSTGQWAGPTFHTIGEVSFGLQIGGEASEIILLLLTERGVSSLLSSSVKLGADATIALGPVGIGASAATANLSADILAFSRSKGLYGGISVQGAVVASRGGLNRAYYGQDVSPADILIRRTVTNPQAAGLIESITKVAGGK